MCLWLGCAIDLLCDGTTVILHLWASVPEELSAFVCVYLLGISSSPASTSQRHNKNKEDYTFLKRLKKKRSYMQHS